MHAHMHVYAHLAAGRTARGWLAARRAIRLCRQWLVAAVTASVRATEATPSCMCRAVHDAPAPMQQEVFDRGAGW